MAAERDAFGFYFSAHPVEAHRHLLSLHKVKSFAELAEVPIADGERGMATMAGLVEDARWRTSAKGRRYMMATLSDRSGQFVVSAFDDDACAALEAAAKRNACALVTVELDRRAGDELPRVTVRKLEPLDALASRTRLQLTVRISDRGAVEPIIAELASARGAGNGCVRLIVPLEAGGEATLLGGRDFTLDDELALRIEHIAGEGSTDLSAQEPPRLALVG